MMRVAITGATGFVGSQLYEKLLNSGFACVPLVRDTRRFPDARNYSFDMTANELEHSLSGCTHLVHLAARVHHMVDQPNASEIYSIANEQATQRLAMAANKVGITRFVFMSTAKVYGEHSLQNHAFSVGDPEHPIGPYAQSKLRAEKILANLSGPKNFASITIRPPLIYGPGVRANFQSLIKLSGIPFPLPVGSVKNKRSLVYIENLTGLIVAALRHQTYDNLTVNVSDGEDVSTPQLIQLIAAEKRRKQIIFPFPEPILRQVLTTIGKRSIAERLFDNFQLSIAATQHILNWKPEFSLAEGIHKTITR
jgi:UDP-glucose 4-epimerase